MSTSRDRILGRLRDARKQFTETPPPPEKYLPMVPIDDTSTQALVKRFVEAARGLACTVHEVVNDGAGIEKLLEILEDDTQLLAWDFEHIPLKGLEDALKQASIEIAEPGDPSVRVGVTGAEAALASTGSLVYKSGPGRHRLTSLLPPVHVGIIRHSMILPGFEDWIADRRAKGIKEAFRDSSNIVLISGPSRTADIAMESIMGVHGPGTVHVIVLPG
jgi:L-lactate dehydrogenase complex protein LldG